MLGKIKQYLFIQQVFAECLPCARGVVDTVVNNRQSPGPPGAYILMMETSNKHGKE